MLSKYSFPLSVYFCIMKFVLFVCLSMLPLLLESYGCVAMRLRLCVGFCKAIWQVFLPYFFFSFMVLHFMDPTSFLLSSGR